MTDLVTIPLLPNGESVFKDYPVVGQPGWWRYSDTNGAVIPIVRCNCGSVSVIASHAVYADGRVTPSFWHKRGDVYPEDPNGCDWHVWLKLADWDMGDAGPERK